MSACAEDFQERFVEHFSGSNRPPFSLHQDLILHIQQPVFLNKWAVGFYKLAFSGLFRRKLHQRPGSVLQKATIFDLSGWTLPSSKAPSTSLLSYSDDSVSGLLEETAASNRSSNAFPNANKRPSLLLGRFIFYVILMVGALKFAKSLDSTDISGTISSTQDMLEIIISKMASSSFRPSLKNFRLRFNIGPPLYLLQSNSQAE
ncbi:hypothetical protein Aperf_G00000077415 [Anoplocephala perfoliata]